MLLTQNSESHWYNLFTCRVNQVHWTALNTEIMSMYLQLCFLYAPSEDNFLKFVKLPYELSLFTQLSAQSLCVSVPPIVTWCIQRLYWVVGHVHFHITQNSTLSHKCITQENRLEAITCPCRQLGWSKQELVCSIKRPEKQWLKLLLYVDSPYLHNLLLDLPNTSSHKTEEEEKVENETDWNNRLCKFNMQLILF